MKMRNGIVELQMPRGYSVHEDSVSYTDVDGNRFHVPTALLVLLYEGAQHHMKDRDWKQYTDNIVERAREKTREASLERNKQ